MLKSKQATSSVILQIEGETLKRRHNKQNTFLSRGGIKTIV